jgi:Putative beta barrel porin-7 (BBP7)
MKKNLLAVIAVGVFSGLAAAQGLPAPIPPAPICPESCSPDSPTMPGLRVPTFGDAPDCSTNDPISHRLRLSAESLYWWIKSPPISAPLVTLASPADTAAVAALQPVAAGALTEPGTQILIGARPVNLDAFNGMRLSAGWTLDDAGRWSIEGSYFVLERRQSFFAPGASPDGSTIFARPIFNNVNGSEIAEIDAIPGFFTGTTNVSTSSRLYGWELNTSFNAVRESGFRWDLLGGVRVLDLNEGLAIRDNMTQLVPGVLTFLGAALPNGASLTDLDSFGAANHFWGPQIGSRFEWQSDQFRLEVLTKLAMGVTEQLVTINGATSMVGPGGVLLASAPGGVLALPTNIGRHVRDEFTVVPEVGLNFGYRVTPQIELRVGYTFLYWSSVARPGNQIDRSVNTSLVPSDPFYGNGGGQNRPAENVTGSSFWAQGINAGLLFEF